MNLNQWNFRNYTQKFYDAINLRDKEVRQKLVQGFDNYEKEKLHSGLMILKNKLNETGIGNKTTGSSSINLKWKGSKTQMYYVIRQLKSNKVLVSSYEDIGLFLIQNIDKFAGSQLSTVINELQKTKYDKIPTGKRIDLKGLNELNEDQI